MQLTMPQIIMLNHAASVNYKRMQSRVKRDDVKKKQESDRDEKDPVVWRGKRLGEMDSLDMQQYYGGMFG